MKALYFDEHGELDVVKFGDVPTLRDADDDGRVRPSTVVTVKGGA